MKLFLFLFIFVSSYSQKNTVVSGGVATGTNGSSSYSIGQVDYKTQLSTTGFISQGVQQPYEVIVLVNDQFNEIQVNITVSPNPTKDIATIYIEDLTKWGDLEFNLFDINGRIIQENRKITTSNTDTNLSILPIGIYFLKITASKKLVKTFKIIKNQ